MSAISARQYECEQCGDTVDRAGAYCSPECRLTRQGENILNTIRNDHTVCATCFRRLKVVDRPSDDWLRANSLGEITREAIVGFEYPTPNRHQDHGVSYCECGTVEHHADHEFLKHLEANAVVANLLQVLRQMYDDGQIEDPPDERALVEALVRSDWDWPLAIGTSLNGIP